MLGLPSKRRSWAARKCCKSNALAPDTYQGQSSTVPNGRLGLSSSGVTPSKNGSGNSGLLPLKRYTNPLCSATG